MWIFRRRIRNVKCDQCEYAAGAETNIKMQKNLIHDKNRDYRCDQYEYAARANCAISAQLKDRP